MARLRKFHARFLRQIYPLRAQKRTAEKSKANGPFAFHIKSERDGMAQHSACSARKRVQVGTCINDDVRNAIKVTVAVPEPPTLPVDEGPQAKANEDQNAECEGCGPLRSLYFKQYDNCAIVLSAVAPNEYFGILPSSTRPRRRPTQRYGARTAWTATLSTASSAPAMLST